MNVIRDYRSLICLANCRYYEVFGELYFKLLRLGHLELDFAENFTRLHADKGSVPLFVYPTLYMFSGFTISGSKA